MDKNNWSPFDWSTPQGLARFFISGGVALGAILAGVGVLLWGIGQLIH